MSEEHKYTKVDIEIAYSDTHAQVYPPTLDGWRQGVTKGRTSYIKSSIG